MGAEGIQGSLPWPGALAEDAANFAKQAMTLYRDEQEWQRQQARGDEILAQRFHREEIGHRVLGQVESCLKDLEAHRRKNFIGQILQHQSMRATQYMSQWIEAKNQSRTEE